MSFYILNKLSKNLKWKLTERLDTNDFLTVKDYIDTFCECFERNNSFKMFSRFDPKKDRMSVTVFFTEYQRIIYLERKFRIENDDEEYQLQLELRMDRPFTVRVSEVYEIERDFMGDFHNFESGYMHFSDYRDRILASENMNNLVGICADSVCISMNSDL